MKTLQKKIQDLEYIIALHKLDYRQKQKQYMKELAVLKEKRRIEKELAKPVYINRMKPDHIVRWLQNNFKDTQELEETKAKDVYTRWVVAGGQPGVRSFVDYMEGLGFVTKTRRVNGVVMRVYINTNKST